MSLVYEALQKAEREKERRTGVSPVPPTAATPGPLAQGAVATAPTPLETKPAARNYISTLVLGVSLAALAALAYIIVVVTKSIPTPRAEDGATRSVASAPPAVAPAPSAPHTSAAPAPAPTANDPRFHLTGIMGWPDGGFGAVINGKNVREGYYIDGAIVKKIERDRVTLQVDGNEVVLRLY